MTKETVTMSHKEVNRLGVIEQVVDKRLKQKAAAERLGLSVRQVKRLVQRYRAEGASGLVSRHRGKHPGNAMKTAVREAILRQVRQHYADFGPTLAAEKLAERHGY